MNRNFLLAILSIIAGSLFVLAFSPLNWYLFGFIAPALLLYCWKDASPKKAFWLGFLFGLGEFITGASWIYISIHKFGNATVFLAGLITAIFIVFMSSYPALQGYVFRKFFRRSRLLAQCLFAFPSTWVLFEYLRAYLFTGFPWLLLGYTQTTTLLGAYAPLLGVFGISLIVSLISGALILIIYVERVPQKVIAAALIIILVVVAFPLEHRAWTKTSKKSLSVALVQGNVPQSLKWDPAQAINTVKKYINATKPHWNTQLIIWPEAAIPIVSYQAKDLIAELNSIATQHRATLIFGIPAAKSSNSKFYNAIMTVGIGHGSYYKRHPVPFGEYIPLGFIFNPLMSYFDIPMSDLSKGPIQQPLLHVQNITAAPFVCYEITYPFEVLKYSRNSQLLITVNDDSWFGNSLAQPQQIQMAKMRAMETGRSILYVSNTGITAIIGPNGQLLQQVPENELRVLHGKVYPATGNTPIMVYSFYPLLLITLLLFVLGFYHRRKESDKP